MDFQSANQIEHALSRLGELLDASGADPVGLLVCGGASLIVRGQVTRTTHDVDVIAYFGRSVPDQSELQRHTEFHDVVVQMAAQIAADMDLDEDWLNLGPSSLVVLGLPDGIMNRAQRRDYGQWLTVFFLDRLDQIHLKLYAALQREERHVQDLLALKPTDGEMLQAKRWIETVAGDAVLPSDLAALIKELGYERIIC